MVLIGLFLGCLLLGGCGTWPERWQPGPKGPLGPQGDVGPQGDLGPSSKDAIVIKRTGEPVEREYDLSGFSEIEVCDFLEAEIRQGETYRVTVEAEETLMPYVEVVVRGTTLHIGLRSGHTFNMENVTKRVEVTLPALTRVMAGNHSELRLAGFETEADLQLEVIDFGLLQGSVEARNLQVDVSNHSELILTGSASQVMGELTDFSDADLTGMEAAGVDIDTDTHSSLAR
jgi:hypothetical protein